MILTTIFNMKKILITTILLTPLFSIAQDSHNFELVAKQVAQHALNLPKPKTDLEKWTSDMWNFSAITCLKQANVPLPAYFNNIKPHSNGTYRLPKNINSYCENLSGGPAIQCFNLKSTQPPFGMPLPGMSRDYMYLEKEISSLNQPIMVGGYCYLSAKSTHQDRQFFAGNGKFQWTQTPIRSNINTVSGQQSVLMGNGIILVDGLQQSFPVVVIKK